MVSLVAIDLFKKSFKTVPGHFTIQREILLRTKDLRKVAGKQASQKKVGIGQRKVPLVAVTDRTGISAGGFGPHSQHSIFEKQARSPSGGHGLDV